LNSQRLSRPAKPQDGKRLGLPWVAVQKDYEFDTEEGKKSLADLFEGHSQLLAYNIMFGPAYSRGACPGCTSLRDELGGRWFTSTTAT
jgi:predicted dithiol-disulfide oxidoreductase (DUF899 family)